MRVLTISGSFYPSFSHGGPIASSGALRVGERFRLQ